MTELPAWLDKLTAALVVVGVVFALVGFTWFAVLVYQQPDRLGYFLGYEVYDRVFTAAHARNAEWYGGFEVYLPVFLLGALPWWALAIVAAGGPRGAWRSLLARVPARDQLVRASRIDASTMS